MYRLVIILPILLCAAYKARAEPAALTQLKAQAAAFDRGGAPPALQSSTPAPVPASNAREAVVAIIDRLKSRMSPERRARMDRLRVDVVRRDESVVAAALRLIRSTLGDAAASQVERGLRDDYAYWNALGAAAAQPRVAAPIRGLSQFLGGHAFCLVGEENVRAVDWDEHGSRAGRIAVHEFAHAVEYIGLTDEERAELDRIWLANLRRRGVPDSESGQKTEFFAESTEAWFSVHQHSPNEAGHGPDFFYSRFPVMADFLERIYGPGRRIE